MMEIMGRFKNLSIRERIRYLQRPHINLTLVFSLPLRGFWPIIYCVGGN